MSLLIWSFKFNFEKLYRKDGIYDVIFILNFNTNPVEKNKGSAIFIHIAKRNYSATRGCIAIKRNDIKKLACRVNKNTLVKILYVLDPKIELPILTNVARYFIASK